MRTFGWIKRNYAWIAGGSGVVLVIVGVLLATGRFTQLVAPLQRFVPKM
jgi:hypothetical protein